MFSRLEIPSHDIAFCQIDPILGDLGLQFGRLLHGRDHFAERIAKERGLTITIHYPDWNGKGKGAGFARNTTIAEDADILIACVAGDRKGGTEDTIKTFLKSNPEDKLILVPEAPIDEDSWMEI